LALGIAIKQEGATEQVTGYWYRLQVIRTPGMLILLREASRGFK